MGHCQIKTDPNAEFIKQLTHLKEFTRSEKRIDSIAKKEGIPFKIGIGLTTTPAITDDKTGKIVVAFVSFDRGMDHIRLYTEKFDREKQTIVSVKREQLGTSLAEYGWTDKKP